MRSLIVKECKKRYFVLGSSVIIYKSSLEILFLSYFRSRMNVDCRQFGLLTWISFIGQFVNPVRGEGMV